MGQNYVNYVGLHYGVDFRHFQKTQRRRRSQDDILLPIYVLSTMSGKTAPDVSRERNLVWPAPGQYMQPSNTHWIFRKALRPAF